MGLISETLKNRKNKLGSQKTNCFTMLIRTKTGSCSLQNTNSKCTRLHALLKKWIWKGILWDISFLICLLKLLISSTAVYLRFSSDCFRQLAVLKHFPVFRYQALGIGLCFEKFRYQVNSRKLAGETDDYSLKRLHVSWGVLVHNSENYWSVCKTQPLLAFCL